MVTQKPVAWICRTCGKFDTADDQDALAKPEHVSYRGTDIGTCKGKMVPLYEAFPIVTVDKEVTKMAPLVSAVLPVAADYFGMSHKHGISDYNDWKSMVVNDAIEIAEMILNRCEGR